MTKIEAKQLNELLEKLAFEGSDALVVLQAEKTLSYDELHIAVALLEELY